MSLGRVWDSVPNVHPTPIIAKRKCPLLIEFKHVSKTYPNGVKGLKDVNLKFEQGEFVAIIGLSGAGKSTLIRTINRMIDITEGELTVDGTDVSKLSGKALRKFRRKIGMIFQSFNLVTRATALAPRSRLRSNFRTHNGRLPCGSRLFLSKKKEVFPF